MIGFNETVYLIEPIEVIQNDYRYFNFDKIPHYVYKTSTSIQMNRDLLISYKRLSFDSNIIK